MKKINVLLVISILNSGLALLGCASSPVQRTASAADNHYAVIQSIETVPAGSGSTVAGTVIGGAAGAVVGHQVGQGNGNDLATAGGAVGGAIIGHELQQQSNQRQVPTTQYRVRVRFNNGSEQAIMQDNVSELRVGDRVHVENGRVWR